MKRVNKQESNSDLLDESRFEKNEEMAITREIDGTPFMIVGLLKESGEGRNWFGALGTIRLTQMMESEEDAIKQCSDINWTNIVNLISGIMELKEREAEKRLKLNKAK